MVDISISSLRTSIHLGATLALRSWALLYMARVFCLRELSIGDQEES